MVSVVQMALLLANNQLKTWGLLCKKNEQFWKKKCW
jgi:hypothetical protein